MNRKQRIYLLLYFLIPFLVIIPVVYSIPSVTVQSPNGSEIWSGINTIKWSMHSPEYSQDLNAILYYSIAEGKQENLIADLNAFESCGFDSIAARFFPDSDFNAGNFLSGLAGTGISNGTFFMNGNVLNYITSSHSDTTDREFNSYTWNETTDSWDVNDFLSNGLGLSQAGVAGRTNIFESFEKDGTVYLLLLQRVSGTNTDIVEGYDWNGNGWNSNTDINNGLQTDDLFYFNGLTEFSVINKSFVGQDWWLVTSGTTAAHSIDSNSFYYNDTTNSWVNYNYLASNIGNAFLAMGDSFDMFESSNQLYGVAGYANNPPSFAIFDESDGQWEEVLDINTGIFNVTQRDPVVFEYDAKTYLIGFETAASPSYKYFYEFRLGSFDSSTPADCTYSWDTNGIDNGLYWLDINAIDYGSDANSSVVDSSNARFRILNWTNDDIQCTCVSNCSSCVLDVNTFIVTPANQSGNVEIKIENQEGEKNVGYKIKNGLVEAEQYKIYSATVSDYGNSIWNYDNTLTFGSSNYDSVQKIWNSVDEKYYYFFDDLILSDETIYYKFEYYEPAFHWFTLNDPDWDNQLSPSEMDYNALETDLFQVSTYSDMSSFLIEPHFPQITSNDSESANYVLQFTSKSDATFSGELKAGVVDQRDFSPSTSLNLEGSYKTLTVTDLSGGYMKIETAATTAREIWIQNYVITEKGYFTKPIEIFDEDGSELPVMIKDNNVFDQYVVEGKNFLVTSQYNDPDGIVDKLEITAYINAVDSANKIKKWVIDVSDEEDLVDISETIGGLIDLTADAPDRTVKLTMRLIDTNALYYEIQSTSFTLRQFPATEKDLLFRISQYNKKIGDHPKGRITLQTIAPENIIGVDFQIQDAVGDNNNADFNKIFYKDIDFSCNAFECSFDYEIEEYIFPASGNFRIDAWALVKTETKGAEYGLLHKLLAFPVSWITFNTARIFQTFERTDHVYRADEIIPLTVQLKSSDGASLKNKIVVKLKLAECDADVNAGGTCTDIDLNYTPDSFIYDRQTGYNYYNFRQIFLEADYSPLDDGMYYRFKAFIEDPSKTHETLYEPVLADKCQTRNNLTWWENLFTMNFFSWGCNAYTDEIVALPDSNGHEERIFINKDHTTDNPNQYWWACTEPDQNNLYSDVLAQDILCFTFYQINEKPIDKFKFYLTNENSDMGETEEDYKQFIEVEVPADLIYFNDMALLKEALRQEYSTDSIDNIGEFVQYQANYFLGALTPSINIAADYLSASGLIGNVGFQMGATASGNTTDFNYNTPLNPESLTGILTYRIRNINIVNKKDYETIKPQAEFIDAKRFIEYADMENLTVRSKPIYIDVFISDNVKIMSEKSRAKLVIDEDLASPNINVERADANSPLLFESIPTRLKFEAISDLIYNNEKAFIRRYLVLPYRLVLESQNLCGWFGIGCAFIDESGSITALVTQGDLSFFAVNWFAILMLMVAILFISVVYGNIKGKGIQIQLPFRKGE